MKKVIIECSQMRTYRKVVEVEDSDYEVLMALRTLDDADMIDNEEAYQLMEDIMTDDDLNQIEDKFSDIVVTDVIEK